MWKNKIAKIRKLVEELNQNFLAPSSPPLLSVQVQNMFKGCNLWLNFLSDLTKGGSSLLSPLWLRHCYGHIVQNQGYWEIDCFFDANIRGKRSSKEFLKHEDSETRNSASPSNRYLCFVLIQLK